jgi:hypothetical protein
MGGGPTGQYEWKSALCFDQRAIRICTAFGRKLHNQKTLHLRGTVCHLSLKIYNNCLQNIGTAYIRSKSH